MPVQMFWLWDANINASASASANVTVKGLGYLVLDTLIIMQWYYHTVVQFLYAICGYYFNLILLHGLLELLLPAVGDRSCYGGGVEEYAQEGESGGWALLLRFC